MHQTTSCLACLGASYGNSGRRSAALSSGLPAAQSFVGSGPTANGSASTNILIWHPDSDSFRPRCPDGPNRGPRVTVCRHQLDLLNPSEVSVVSVVKCDLKAAHNRLPR